jgi:hypothetical protein
MESQGRVPDNETDDGNNQSADLCLGTGLCPASLPGSESLDLPGEGGTLAQAQQQANDLRPIEMEYLRDLHELAIHKFNKAKGDFPLGFWNGYGCAIKAIIEKLQPPL